MKNQKVWYVTGASKGLGLNLVKLLLSNGNKVAATSRNSSAFDKLVAAYPDNLLPLAVDITRDESVKQSISQTIGNFGKLDVVVNNAGYSLVGSIEELSDQEFRETIDVNLFGTVNTIRAAMPHFRKQGSGHFINISSNAGYIGFATAGSYNAAKFAVVGISEALAEESKAFGIKVTVVAPGQFRTSFMDSLAFAENKIAVYKLVEAEKMWREYSGTQRGDPAKLAQVLMDLANHPNPPLHLLAGPDTYQLVTEHREKEKQEFAAWKDITLSTDFDQ
ncbi:NADP-dependent 3-hydroxy acid dehydrogenase YdfG [Mucilaginibacter gracilis]|uniref:NADP-dependent 3-hydroxy acid dehydrogenase YdfG n=1 Tax=Mucilaginibacter gracilis TaxID=423350 RepID=A0A495J7S8_9SPHI|nr:SDR family NAD(P)-dependent oxidoreductase [Mucilaginibacter gracilis]RKR84069.1 NADP-dependent 3-hydroxy acid dehydrogenase YdfG [Mucilaginibacter gracilis]